MGTPSYAKDGTHHQPPPAATSLVLLQQPLCLQYSEARRGDAWFGQLLASYRQVPAREAAAEMVQAFEMAPIEPWGRDSDEMLEQDHTLADARSADARVGNGPR